jgi:hypothetical protein
VELATYRDRARRDAPSIDTLVREGRARECAVIASLAAALRMELGTLARHVATLRSKDVLDRFFGEGIEPRSGAWISLDGRRRLRSVAGDPLPRYEELDAASGETLASVRGPAPLVPMPDASAVLERRVRIVHGRACSPRFFAGIPRALGGRPAALGDPAIVVLEVHSTGVLLLRKDERGAPAGDTHHADVRAAERQLESEYGDRLGTWQSTLREPVRAPAAWVGPGRAASVLL